MYHRDLFERYGIYALTEDASEYEEAAGEYLDYSFNHHGSYDRMHIKRISTDVNFTGYSLLSVSRMKEQMKQVAKVTLPGTLIDFAKEYLTEETSSSDSYAATSFSWDHAGASTQASVSDGQAGGFSSEASADVSFANFENGKTVVAALANDSSVSDSDTDAENTDTKDGDTDLSGTEETQNRTLRNSAVLDRLPSRISSLAEDTLSLGDSFDLENLIEEKSGTLWVDVYIVTHFGSHTKESQTKESQTKESQTKENEQTFFRNELEYILEGKTSDEENYNRVLTDLTLLRTALNALYLYTSPLRREEAALIATLISGPAFVLTEEAVMAGWLLLETANDMELLKTGEKVPLYKTDETWKISMEGLKEKLVEDPDLEGETVFQTELTDSFKEGLSYDQYLFLLLLLKKEETKVLRAMDLIQINMIAFADAGFSFDSSYDGFSLETKWTQEKLSFLPETLRTHTVSDAVCFYPDAESSVQDSEGDEGEGTEGETQDTEYDVFR